MQNDEKQKPSHPRSDVFDTNKPLDSQWARSVLSSVSAILKKHAEILAFYEAKNLKQEKTHDVSASWDATARFAQSTTSQCEHKSTIDKIRYEKYS